MVSAHGSPLTCLGLCCTPTTRRNSISGLPKGNPDPYSLLTFRVRSSQVPCTSSIWKSVVLVPIVLSTKADGTTTFGYHALFRSMPMRANFLLSCDIGHSNALDRTPTCVMHVVAIAVRNGGANAGLQKRSCSSSLEQELGGKVLFTVRSAS